MWKNVLRMRQKHGEEFNIAPMSYVLPDEYAKFQLDRENDQSKNGMWILKPHASSCGRGIKIISKKTPVSDR